MAKSKFLPDLESIRHLFIQKNDREEWKAFQKCRTREIQTMFRKFKEKGISQKPVVKTRPDGTPYIKGALPAEALVDLEKMFEECFKGKMPMKKLRQILYVYNNHLVFTDRQFKLLFLKMDWDLDGYVTWDDFTKYLVLEGKERQRIEKGFKAPLLELPLKKNPRFLKSRHKHPIICVTFWPNVSRNRSVVYAIGKYVTASREGCLNFWNVNMELVFSAYSVCPDLSVTPTFLTCVRVLCDINVVCTSSTERDLRFYDVTSNRFETRMMITSMKYAVVTMYYLFFEDVNKKSMLICGDMGGNLKILYFNSKDSGPFKPTVRVDYRYIRYYNLEKGYYPDIWVFELKRVHCGWVEAIDYYKPLQYIVSCSNFPAKALVIIDTNTWTRIRRFDCTYGIGVFAFFPIVEHGEERKKRKKIRKLERAEKAVDYIITGGIDGIIRIWTMEDSNEPEAMLVGHHSRIVALIVQKGRLIMSLAKSKIIKVWDFNTLTCIQTYAEKLHGLGTDPNLHTFYNPYFYTLVIATSKIALVKLHSEIDAYYSDGYSHLMEITCVKYNPVFNLVVTVGMDSCITIWDINKGHKPSFMITKAHVRRQYGEYLPVGITTATFNPTFTLLLTGGLNGTIKMWNFISGKCLREMSIGEQCPISKLVWIRKRILAMGWNRGIAEWEDSFESGPSKSWASYHTEDILAAELCPPFALATSSYNGELVFCRLQTGMSYRKYLVSDPNKHVSMSFTMAADVYASAEKAPTIQKITYHQSGGARRIGVHAMKFLQDRRMSPDVGTVMVALESGLVQMWSHHPVGGYMNSFRATHHLNDYVVSMATDAHNKFLFTGHVFGYIKTWLLENYGVPNPPKVSVPLLRLQFPFLSEDKILGRAKRAVLDQPLPILVDSHKAHVNAVTHIEYMKSCDIIISSGMDRAVRFWTVGGLYLNTLGSFNWIKGLIIPGVRPKPYRPRIPADLRRVLSSTSYKVLTNNFTPVVPKATETDEQYRFRKMIEARTATHPVFGKPIEKPILGHYFKLPSCKTNSVFEPNVDMSMGPNVRILCHLNTYVPATIKKVPPPAVVLTLLKKKKIQKLKRKKPKVIKGILKKKEPTFPVPMIRKPKMVFEKKEQRVKRKKISRKKKKEKKKKKKSKKRKHERKISEDSEELRKVHWQSRSDKFSPFRDEFVKEAKRKKQKRKDHHKHQKKEHGKHHREGSASRKKAKEGRDTSGEEGYRKHEPDDKAKHEKKSHHHGKRYVCRKHRKEKSVGGDGREPREEGEGEERRRLSRRQSNEADTTQLNL